MGKNIMVVCSVASFLNFEMNDIKILIELGNNVYIGTNFQSRQDAYEEVTQKMKNKIVQMGIVPIQIDFTRSPVSRENIKAYFQVKKAIKEYNINLIHCHTAAASAITRLSAKSFRRKGQTKVIYTAHGFYFYSGSNIKNWILFYPVEKLLLRITDLLITITREDYLRAKKYRFPNRILYLPGVGVDTEKFNVSIYNTKVRQLIGVPENAFFLLSIGELNANKNYISVINAIKKCNKDIYYVIAGEGIEYDHLCETAKTLGVENNIRMLGYRSDVVDLYKSANALIAPSFREGLSIAIVEAMASGIPVLCSRIRGNVDLIDEGMGGYLFDPHDEEDIFAAIVKIYFLDSEQRKMMGEYNENKAKKFDVRTVEIQMRKIYSEYI